MVRILIYCCFYQLPITFQFSENNNKSDQNKHKFLDATAH